MDEKLAELMRKARDAKGMPDFSQLRPTMTPEPEPETVAAAVEVKPATPTLDLSKLPPEVHAMFNDIVLHGALAQAGMGNFSDVLTAADANAIHAYLIDQERQGYEKQQHR